MTELKEDIEYIKERNKLIPLAEAYANNLHGEKSKSKNNKAAREVWAANWSRTFVLEMNRLWKERIAK